jgi:hypothetical protein
METDLLVEREVLDHLRQITVTTTPQLLLNVWETYYADIDAELRKYYRCC